MGDDGKREKKLDSLVAALAASKTTERRKTARRELEKFAGEGNAEKFQQELDEALEVANHATARADRLQAEKDELIAEMRALLDRAAKS